MTGRQIKDLINNCLAKVPKPNNIQVGVLFRKKRAHFVVYFDGVQKATYMLDYKVIVNSSEPAIMIDCFISDCIQTAQGLELINDFEDFKDMNVLKNGDEIEPYEGNNSINK